MHLERYELKTEDSFLFFEFISIGAKGQIQKAIKFNEMIPKGIYNLSFGDHDPVTGNIDDTTTSNNGDSKKVLATVVSAITAFTNKYPGAWIYATGSTRSRNRLYRMGLNKYLNEFKKEFDIYGIKDNSLQIFERDVDYEAFLDKKK